MKFRSIINYTKVLKRLNYSKKWIKRSENASAWLGNGSPCLCIITFYTNHNKNITTKEVYSVYLFLIIHKWKKKLIIVYWYIRVVVNGKLFSFSLAMSHLTPVLAKSVNVSKISMSKSFYSRLWFVLYCWEMTHQN